MFINTSPTKMYFTVVFIKTLINQATLYVKNIKIFIA